MRKGTATTIALAIGALAVVVPIWIALYVAKRLSLEGESAQALTVAGEVLRRGEEIAKQFWSAHHRLRVEAAPEHCSDANIALMRDIEATSSYMEIVGHVADNRLMCSSLGHHGKGIPMGPREFVSTLGDGMRSAVDLGVGAGSRFVVMDIEGYAFAAHGDVALNAFVDRPDIAVGVVSNSTGHLLSNRGTFKRSWIASRHDALQVAFFDGDHVIGIQRSKVNDIAAYAALPAGQLHARVQGLAAVLVPLGLVLGAGMAFAMFYWARQQATLPVLLRAALSKREFVLHYQPIVELQTRRVVGVEALLRWPLHDGSTLSPNVFIPAAEDCGLIQLVTEYVLDAIAVDAARLQRHFPDWYISINLSSSDLHSNAVIASLKRLIDKAHIPPRNIIVEATEHSFLHPEIAKHIINDIRALGIRVAIDDFGTGYSSLAYLTTLQTDYLKIDKSFVDTVGTDAATSEVALHIIRIAGSLSMKVIAEGIETEVQASFLRDAGVAYAQGWLFGKAMPLEQLLQSYGPGAGPSASTTPT